MRTADIVPIQQDVIVTNEDLDDILDTAGYGIGYWATCMDVTEDITKGGTVIVTLDEPIEDGGATEYKMRKEDLLKGIRLYLQDPNKPYDILWFNEKTCKTELDTGNADAVVCDMIIQYALFDEIVFS